MDIQSFKPQINELALKHKLDFVVCFGSVATGKTHPKSDVDIAVISKSRFDILKLTMDFYDLFKREDVDVVDLSLVSPTLAHAVVRDGVLLYEREGGAFLNWKVYAIKIWMETKWLRDLSAKLLIEWAGTNKN